jgi:hypothetical protein
MSQELLSFTKTRSILVLIAVLLGVCGLAFAIHGLLVYGFCVDKLNLLGDYLGGTTGSFWGAASLIVVYLGFEAQRSQLVMQSEEIKETKISFEKQQFENTFFILLNLHSQTVRDIDLTSGTVPIRGKDCIRTIYQELKSIGNNSPGDSKQERIRNAFEEVSKSHSLDITTYVNSLRPIIRLLDSQPSNIEIEFYDSILASQLSNYESAFLFYYQEVDRSFSGFLERSDLLKSFAVSLPGSNLEFR